MNYTLLFVLQLFSGFIFSQSSIRLLDVETFLNGDEISEAKSIIEWTELGRQNKPAFMKKNIKGKNYFFYNGYTLNDSRELITNSSIILDQFSFIIWKSESLIPDFEAGSISINGKLIEYDNEQKYWTIHEKDENYSYAVKNSENDKDDNVSIDNKKNGYLVICVDRNENDQLIEKFEKAESDLKKKAESEFKQSISELNDNFKDSRNIIYGRGKTTLSQEEAYNLAKKDIINKYIKRHKRRYKNITVLNNDNIELKYEFVYRKPLNGSEEHFILLRATIKNIRLLLKTYEIKEEIKKEEIKKTPKTGNYKEMTLREGLEDSYNNGKEVLVIFGLEGSENTEKILNHIFIDLYEYYSKYYTLVFVNNSDNQSEKDLSTIVDKNYSTINTYPRVIKLKRPTSIKEINDLEIKITSNVAGRNFLQD